MDSGHEFRLFEFGISCSAFFLLSEVLLSTSMVHYLSVGFERTVQRIFNVPGAGSFVFSMGLVAGYRMDAVLTAKFRKRNLCTEGDRLLACSNNTE